MFAAISPEGDVAALYKLRHGQLGSAIFAILRQRSVWIVDPGLLGQFFTNRVAVNQGVVFACSRMTDREMADPTSYLDSAIVRIAVRQARNLIAQGVPADEAVRLACPGPWSQLRVLVQSQLDSGQ